MFDLRRVPFARTEWHPTRSAPRETVGAKYTYAFWRPLTAIGNGDLDDKLAIERDGSPLDRTSKVPEYACAQCTVSGADAAAPKTPPSKEA